MCEWKYSDGNHYDGGFLSARLMSLLNSDLYLLIRGVGDEGGIVLIYLHFVEITHI